MSEVAKCLHSRVILYRPLSLVLVLDLVLDLDLILISLLESFFGRTVHVRNINKSCPELWPETIRSPQIILLPDWLSVRRGVRCFNSGGVSRACLVFGRLMG